MNPHDTVAPCIRVNALWLCTTRERYVIPAFIQRIDVNVSSFLTFSISISATVFKTLYPKVAENAVEKMRKEDKFPTIRYSIN
jgi:hypothetical protein